MTDMRADQIEIEIEDCLAVLRGAASQSDYDLARARLLVLRDALKRKSSWTTVDERYAK
jgi:hypothetical protein